MERRKVVVDLQQLDLLEQKVVKATETIRALRRERDALDGRLREAQEGLAAARQDAAGAEKQKREHQDLLQEVQALQDERQAIRGKVSRMLEMMEVLEEAPAEARREH
jgi:uncharacterized coiled-coil DUF342 family protein